MCRQKTVFASVYKVSLCIRKSKHEMDATVDYPVLSNLYDMDGMEDALTGLIHVLRGCIYSI